MRLIYILFLFLVSNPLLFGQDGIAAALGAQSVGLGGSSVMFENSNSIFSNQAGLAALRKMEFSINSEQRFLLSEIRAISAGGALPVGKSGTFGLGLQYYGFKAFNEQRVSLGYGRKISNKLALGASFIWSNTSIPEYGNKGVFTFDLGLMAHISSKVSFGAHIFNPLRSKITEGEALPSIIKLGLRYQPSSVVRIIGEVEKDIEYGIRTRWGTEYDVLDQLVLRFGLATQPTEFSFGFGYKVKNKIQIDVAASYHQVLGITPSLGVIIR